MKLAVAIIFALVGTMVIADGGKVCPDGLTNLKKYWDGTACKDCPTTCTECNWNGKAASCLSCPAKQFLKVDGETASCADCAKNCKSCRGPNPADCITPEDTYKSSGSAIFKCTATAGAGCQWCSADDKCGKCDIGFQALSATQTCAACGENCAECTSATACTKCTFGFGLNAGACAKCDEGCNECPCKGCKAGYFSATDKGVTTCTKCENSGFCTECATKDTCKTCAKNSQLKDGKCNACSEGANCADCSADSAKCTTCVAGFVANKDGKCVACPANCATCTGDGTTCGTCKTGFWKSTDEKTCTLCNLSCKDLKCNDKDGTCSACADGSFMADDKKSCTACSANCKSCKKADVCDTCDEVSLKIKDSCATPAGKGCKVGETLGADEKCTASTVDNCVYGVTTNCVACAKSYYVDGGKCTPCGVGCDSCTKTGDYVKCTSAPQEYFVAQKTNGKKDLTGYAKDLTAKVNYDGKSVECMPNNLLTRPLLNLTNSQCNTRETCTYPVKAGVDKWECFIDGKGTNAVKVAISFFAMAIAAIFTL